VGETTARAADNSSVWHWCGGATVILMARAPEEPLFVTPFPPASRKGAKSGPPLLRSHQDDNQEKHTDDCAGGPFSNNPDSDISVLYLRRRVSIDWPLRAGKVRPPSPVKSLNSCVIDVNVRRRRIDLSRSRSSSVAATRWSFSSG